MTISTNTHISKFEADIESFDTVLIEGRPMHKRWAFQSLTWSGASRFYRAMDELMAFNASLDPEKELSDAQVEYMRLLEQRIDEAKALTHWAIAHTGEAQVSDMAEAFRTVPVYDDTTLADYCKLEGVTLEQARKDLELEVEQEVSTTQTVTESLFINELTQIINSVEKQYKSCVDSTGHFVPDVKEEIRDFEISDFTYVSLLRRMADKAEQWSMSQNLQVRELAKRKILGKERRRLVRGPDGRVVEDNPMITAKTNELVLQSMARELNLKAHDLQKQIDARPTMVDMQLQREAEEDASYNEENGTVTSYGPGIDRQTLMAERMQQAQEELEATVNK